MSILKGSAISIRMPTGCAKAFFREGGSGPTRKPSVWRLATRTRKGLRSFFLSMNLAVFGPLEYIMESLILAQNERWRRVLSMQVERQGPAMAPRAADW